MNKTEKAFVQFMEDRRDASERHYDNMGYLAAFKRFDKLWNRVLPDVIKNQLDARRKRAGELSQLVPPTIFRFHRDLTSRINQAFRSAEPNFMLVDNYGKVDQELIEKNEHLVQFNFYHDDGTGNFGQKRKKIISDALKYGVGILYPEYSTQYIHTPQLVEGSDGEYQWQPFNKFEGVHFTRILPQRFRPDPYATDRASLRYFMFHKLATIGELKDKEEELELKHLNEIDPNAFYEGDFWKYFPESKQKEPIDTSNKRAVRAAPVMLDYYIDRDGVAIYANRKVLIWERKGLDESRELPIILAVLIPKDDELYGKSVISLIEDNFYEQFHKRNTRLDKQNTSVAGSYKTTDPKLAEKKWLYGGGGRVIHYTQGYEFDKLDFADTTDVDFREEQLVVQEVQDTLALSQIAMGLDPGRQERSTTAAILNENAAVPMQDIIENAEETIVKPAVKKTLDLCNQFLPIDYEHRILGQSPQQMNTFENPREEIKVDLDIVCKTASQFESRTLKRQSMTNWAMTVANFPNAQELDWYQITKQYTSYYNFPDAEKMVPEPESLRSYPRQETLALMQGVDLPVYPTDNDVIHLEVHNEPMQQGIPDTPQMQQHKMLHQQQMAQKQGKQTGGGMGAPSQEMPTSQQDIVKVAGQKVSQGQILGGGER